MKFFIAIPTYNGGEIWKEAARNIQKYAPANSLVYVIDSSSKDKTVNIAENSGFCVKTIASADFNHGGTRNIAVSSNADNNDIVIFLTQDAIPEPEFVKKIISVFDDPSVACAWGRQLPHTSANPIAQHARYFNYPSESHICGSEDSAVLGLKTVFMSNSFSAYRISVFQELGGFPSNTILCEDMYFTAKAVLAGYKVAYVADAVVRHSHNYQPQEEFRRYFDIGVFHSEQPWIREKFGGAGGEGKKFIISELKYLCKKGMLYIPLALLNNLMKIVGYKLGQQYKYLPNSLVKFCSMHKRFWKH
ncbi:glycosyltransferase [Raoultella ornithinolytica]|uniref:glycosyltransferase n=1 Tax=Raoultella ornithinolytica TaxID=54291 RepID=UPI0010BF2EF0|nr:glycosyltransferase family 2 protein [Raoultella ornithinolytica]QCK76349.1 glycosyltransferase [Raoultella ornithinolytica]